MRLLAERYLALAKTSDDSEERRKFLDYAAAYADLAKQIEERQSTVNQSTQVPRC
jgi:hypothetical protein